MSITFDASAAVSQRAGIGRYARELASHLARGPFGPRLRLIAAGWDGAAGALAPSGWRVPAPVNACGWESRRHRLRLLARHALGWPDDRYWGRPRLFHSPDAFAPRLRGCPTAVTVHDLSFRLLPRCHTTTNRLFLEAAVAASTRRAAVVFADSETTGRDLAAHLGVPAGRVRIVHPGVSEAFSPGDPAAARERCACQHGLDRGFVLAVGTVEPRKNHLFLLKAFAILAREHGYPGDLVMVGSRGWGRVPIEDTAARLGIAARVKRLGGIDDDELADLYRGCDVFAMPSLYEGFGIPAAEALACGATAVVSDRGSLPEVVGDAATVVDLGDPSRWARALAAACTAEARARARERGPARAGRFRYEHAARQVEEVYAEWLEAEGR